MKIMQKHLVNACVIAWVNALYTPSRDSSSFFTILRSIFNSSVLCTDDDDCRQQNPQTRDGNFADLIFNPS